MTTGTKAEPRSDEDRRARILDATWQLIAERGFHAVRIADIAKVCGTSTGTVHYYFPGKNDVLAEALKYCVDRAFARQSTQLRAVHNAHERLLKLIDMQLPRVGQVRDEWAIWLQYWAEATIRPEFRPAHNEYYARWQETVRRIVQRGQRQGIFRADADPHVVALRLTALTDGAAIQVLTGVPGMTIGTMRELLVDFVHQELVAGAR
ncbi:TetR/AcrR family transcriptional regulator [Streptomyces iranensis]|uniref:AcrR family transcriptional regulator n=1 Tax=Streptomyces iranensis TaxID=576784 RepID=A0A061AB85_9ACTN|nr:TetR family transcriptional regulator C-terminal domain-containing protein [Streptomyces iranensis]MBP2063714.1 AcrR family transcriptional regulator [Streptomyces iranensis]CDR17691.1 transcriptional regulator, TetR family [Streptomyces iranensis]